MKAIRLADYGTALDGATAAEDAVLVDGIIPFARGFNGVAVVNFAGATGSPVVRIQTTTDEDPTDVGATWSDVLVTDGVLTNQFVGNVSLPEGCTGVRANKTASGSAGDYDAYLLLSD